MIRIANKEIITEKSIEEIVSIIETKTLRTNKGLDSTSTVNMTENEKDFYGYKKNDSLFISRIRRLSILRVLPKLIIVIPMNNKNKQYKIQLGLSTMLLLLFVVIALLSNTYELLESQRFTDDFKSVLVVSTLFLGLLWIEIKMYERKFKKYFG
ncbi:MAG: hypothetical protein ACWA6U_07825 [Breznakibacter sp.]